MESFDDAHDDDLPGRVKSCADGVEVLDKVITDEACHINGSDGQQAVIRYLWSEPPASVKQNKSHVLLLHDQTNDAHIWKELKTMQMLSASGFCCFAPHITSFAFDEDNIISTLQKLISFVGARQLVLIASSMAGIFLVPFLSHVYRPIQFRLMAIIAISVSDTHRLAVDDLVVNPIPCLIIRGTSDTSIGLNAANKLKHMPNSCLAEIQHGKHLCHISNTSHFHKIIFNFLTKLSPQNSS